MCPTGNQDSSALASGFMSMDLYRNIIEQAAGFLFPPQIKLYLGGEPLLHKDIIRMIKIAKRKNLPVNFNTNGALLTEELAEELIRSGLDSIGFSFDDMMPEEYEKIRKNANYHKTLSNIIMFLKKKKKLGVVTPYVSIVSLKLRSDNGNLNAKLEPSAEFCNLFSGFPVAIDCDWAHLWASDSRQRLAYNYRRTAETNISQCHLPWKDLTINYKGEVVSCCVDIMHQYIVGDLAETPSLVELWNNDRMVKL